ncbi:hypothetical protein EX895_004124 [Sporisorium graminicola]|uniref:Autophagy-related protein n=1 Tax=Sporisorium graminicola TaxID=280036 RepID=A0A4U7KTL9_9BASI|nr:hypothetical protein EX895_004124 [Sporisorium graminicola]TKY87446.1 hypothetical protein EX895_004124 [Sporisorium graminicola]
MASPAHDGPSEVPDDTGKPASVLSSAPNDQNLEEEGNVRQKNKALSRFKIAYGLSSFGFSPAFAGMITYGLFQLQTIGFMIGHEPGKPAGTGCMPGATSCRVPWASKGDVNLTSFILYLNAISYAVSGALIFFISAAGDYMNWKREQYVFFVIVYGALCLPMAAMTGIDLKTLNTIAGLYVVFNLVGFIVQTWMKIFIPYTMQAAATTPSSSQQAAMPSLSEQQDVDKKRGASESAGVQMSLWFSNAMNSSTIIFYLIYIGISYASFQAQTSAGLWITTGAGALCVLSNIVAWRWLPNPPKDPNQKKIKWLVLPFTAFAELWRGIRRYPEAFKYLIAYTIYNDSTFAFGSVISQLFNLQVRPSIREFTAYSMTSYISSIMLLTIWYFVRPHLRITLRQWIIVAYSIMAFTCFWCLLGLSASSKVGFKHRWEFYVMAFLQGVCSGVTSACFPVVFCQLFPKGNELKYFGFQLVLSCSTLWIPQVIDGPIVNATNNLRLPAIISFVFFLLCIYLAWWTDDVKGIHRVKMLEAESDNDHGKP